MLPSDIQLVIPVIQHWMRYSRVRGGWGTGRNGTGSIYSLLTCLPWGIKEDKKISKVYSPKPGTTWIQMTTWYHNTNLIGVYCVLFICVLKLAKSLISMPWKFTFPSFVLYIMKPGELFTELSARSSLFCYLCSGSLFINNVMCQYVSDHIP